MSFIFSEFEQADTLLTSEVYLLLEHRRQQSEQKVTSLDLILSSNEFNDSSLGQSYFEHMWRKTVVYTNEIDFGLRIIVN